MELSPFGYNETVAQEYFPLSKDEAVSTGFIWFEKEKNIYQVTLKNKDIPDNINQVNDSILQQIIECAHGGNCHQQCTLAFRLIPQELAVYRKLQIPLPRLPDFDSVLSGPHALVIETLLTSFRLIPSLIYHKHLVFSRKTRCCCTAKPTTRSA